MRLQLKLLSFEGAPLSSLMALLAIYAGFLPSSSAPPAIGRRGSASDLTSGGEFGSNVQGGGSGPEDSPAEEVGAKLSSVSDIGDGEAGEAGEAGEEGGKQLAELGLEGLQSSLGMGTPMLHWSLLETLR